VSCRGKIFHTGTKQYAFVPPQPEEEYKPEVNAKRVLVRKEQQRDRRYERGEKVARLDGEAGASASSQA